MSNITLTSSMRSNLSILRSIGVQMDKTQERLSSGLKVNSAIDNASSFYQARSLTNRAADLDSLLDAMGQGIQTIQAATEGLEAGAAFLEQASVVATEVYATAKIPAKEWLASQEDVAAVVSTWGELDAAIKSGNKGNIVIYGHIKAEDSITLGAGQNLVGIGYYGVEESEVNKFSKLSFDLNKTSSTTAITASKDDAVFADLSITAVMNTNGGIVIDIGGDNNTLQNLDVVMDNKEITSGQYVRAIAGKGTKKYYGTTNITSINSGSFMTLQQGFYNGTHNIFGKVNINLPCGNAYSGRSLQDVVINMSEDSELNATGGSWYIKNLTMSGNSKFNLTGYHHGTSIELDDKAQYNAGSVSPFNSLNLTIKSAESKMNMGSMNNTNVTFDVVADAQLSTGGKVYVAETAINTKMTTNTLPADFVLVSGAVAEPTPSLDWLKERDANRSFEYNGEELGGNYRDVIKQYDALIQDVSYKGVNLLKLFGITNTSAIGG